MENTQIATTTKQETAPAMMNDMLNIWNDKAAIKAQFAPLATDNELAFFISLGQGLGANPFNREIWLVKYGTAAASIFCGRDFYRKTGQAQPAYAGHTVEVVYANDEIEIENGVIVKHRPNLKEPGLLMGAYFIIEFKAGSQRKTLCHRVKFGEYNTGKSLWASKPETMIKKVAESQGFRMAFQDTFKGTYDESEIWAEAAEATVRQTTATPIAPPAPKKTEAKKEAAKAPITPPAPPAQNTPPVTPPQASSTPAKEATVVDSIPANTKPVDQPQTGTATVPPAGPGQMAAKVPLERIAEYNAFVEVAKPLGKPVVQRVLGKVLGELKKSLDLTKDELIRCTEALVMFRDDNAGYIAKYEAPVPPAAPAATTEPEDDLV